MQVLHCRRVGHNIYLLPKLIAPVVEPRCVFSAISCISNQRVNFWGRGKKVMDVTVIQIKIQGTELPLQIVRKIKTRDCPSSTIAAGATPRQTTSRRVLIGGMYGASRTSSQIPDLAAATGSFRICITTPDSRQGSRSQLEYFIYVQPHFQLRVVGGRNQITKGDGSVIS